MDTEEDLISLKNHDDVRRIVDYLQRHEVKDIIRKNFPKVEADSSGLPAYVTDLEYLLSNAEGLLPFYEYALKEQLQVIFTVDL